MRWMVFMVGAAGALLATLSPSFGADLPTSAYPDPGMATEDLDIKVVSLSKRVTENNAVLTRWDIEVVADVRAVRKTLTGLRAGSRIVIRYSGHGFKGPTPMGPRSYPIIAKGVWSAVLNVGGEQKDLYYVPGGAPNSTFGPALK